MFPTLDDYDGGYPGGDPGFSPDFCDRLRECPGCLEWKPLEAFFRPSRVHGWSPVPMRGDRGCRDCQSFWYHADTAGKEAARQYGRERIAAQRASRPGVFRDAAKRASHKRRARAAGALHSPWEPAEVLSRNGGVCVYCAEPATAVDHFHPIAGGGADAPWNLVPACASCNSSKNDSDPYVWMRRTGRRTRFACAALNNPDATAAAILSKL